MTVRRDGPFPGSYRAPAGLLSNPSSPRHFRSSLTGRSRASGRLAAGSLVMLAVFLVVTRSRPRDSSREEGGEGCRNRRSIGRSVNRFVNRTRRNRRDRGDGADGARCDLSCPLRSPHPRETARDARDARRMAHNPEVAGSNPAPATSFRRSRPFPSRERAFCVSGTVAKRVAETRLPAAPQRDGGDGVTRGQTAWTRWTLPPATSGCLAQRAHKCILLCSHSRRTSQKRAEPRDRPSPACRGIRLPRRRDPPCSSSMTASRDAALPMRLRISFNA